MFCVLQGWVPKAELSSERIDMPEKVFFVGQMVRCSVLTCVPDEEKLILSFRVG